MSDILDRIKAECEKSHCKDCPFDGGKGYCWFNDVPAEWNIPAIRAALAAPATGVDVECPGGSQCKVWPGGCWLCIRHPHLEQFTTEPDGEYIESEALDNVIAALSDSTAPADGWISVEDRLPEPSVKVQYLCYGEYPYNDEGGKVHWQYYAAKYHGGVIGWSIIGIGGLNVTHWMPLPPPPTKGGSK